MRAIGSILWLTAEIVWLAADEFEVGVIFMLTAIACLAWRER